MLFDRVPQLHVRQLRVQWGQRIRPRSNGRTRYEASIIRTNLPLFGGDNLNYATSNAPALDFVNVSLEILEILHRWFEYGDAA